ncbi:hypothetical protein ACFPOU_07245 [Massilia jejuensis]|uniref:Uncharacterized protein n=1 Tax=Massilia jejuensis TaxID=648894 RepID=A0ABW0PE47_9BURK
MSRDNAIAAVLALLAEPAYLVKRRKFQEACGERFAPFLRDLHAEIVKIQSANGPLPLYVIDALPARYVRELDGLPAEQRGMLAKEIVSVQMDALAERMRQSKLPPGIIDQYGTAVRYMTGSIVSDDDSAYGMVRSSYFDRDLRLAAGLSLPVGSQIVDMRVWAPATLYRYKGLKANLRALAFVKLELGGLGPLVRIHVDTRNLSDFNEAGRNQCYARIAQLMVARPEIRGMIGTSWFYDPQIQTVSPKLAYLARVPLQNGAFLRIDGASEIHTRRATARSPTRKRLFEEGHYRPVCATMIWSRKKMTNWAREQGFL